MSIEEIKRYYSEYWENPRDIRNVVFDSLNKYVRQRVPLGNGKKALDLGSGHGRIVSYAVAKGYKVTAVEFNEKFVAELQHKFPHIEVICGDVRNMSFDGRFDIVTCIELAQNLDKAQLLALLTKLATVTKLLLINISNRNSLHARWVGFRHWKADFVFMYTPKEFEEVLERAGFEIIHRRGMGLITPISLFKDFKRKLIPIWLARAVNKLDPLATRISHLYYVEAISNKL
jgi:cyclopropane fatty-acyl-phospholipid synthase-like methyltransferase